MPSHRDRRAGRNREGRVSAIPPITDPMGRYWDQPAQSKILIDETHALMLESTLKELCNYSATNPSGVYDGKMWRRQVDYYDETKGWILCWYAPCDDPQRCSINCRSVLIA